MTDDKRNQGKGNPPRQGQQGQFGQSRQQGQFGQSRQPGQHSYPDQSPSQMQQAQQPHRDHDERLHSAQRSGGLGDDQQQPLQAGSVPQVPRQDTTRQQGQSGGISESGDRGAMAQNSLPGGLSKANRTWTQTSGGQQATQASLEGGQWPAQAQGQGQNQGQNQGAGQPQQLAGSQGGTESTGSRRQHNQDARSQATGEFLEQRQGLRGKKDDAASVRQRSQGQGAPVLPEEEQQRQGGAGGQDPNRQPGSGGQRADAVADRMESGDDTGGTSTDRTGRRR